MTFSRAVTLGSALIVSLLGATLWSCARDERPDVVLISIDTLRADRVGSYGYTAAVTPTLDRLATEGLRFDQCTAPTPITLPSHATLFTGRLPAGHGVRNNGLYRLPATVPTLAEQFREAGYATGAAVAAFPLLSRFGLDRGFDHYDDRIEGGAAVSFHNPERPASEVVRAALDWWRGVEDDRPRFLFVHFYEPHHPYEPAPPFDQRFAARPYDGEVATADAAVETLLRGLGADDTRIVMVTSDHGEGLGQHQEQSHGLALYETTQRVPWIVHAPGRVPAGAVIEERVGLVDLAPTLLRLAEVDDSAPGLGKTAGRPLVLDGSEPSRRAYLAETLYPLEFSRWAPAFSLTEGSRKVILSARDRAYDLSIDPEEEQNLLFGPTPGWADDLLEQLRRRVAAFESADNADRTLSQDEREALAALGYTGAGGGAETPAEGDSLLALARELPDVSTRWKVFDALTQAARDIGAARHRRALDRIEEILADEGSSRWALTLKAEALEGLGRVEEAIETYESVDRLASTWFPVKISLARLHLAQQRPRDAIVRYREALHVDPTSALTRVELAQALADVDSLDRALATLERGLEVGRPAAHERARLHTASANLLLRQGRLEEGRPHLDAALASAPVPGTWLVAGRYARADERWAEAEEYLRKASELLPDSGEPWLERGEVARLQGRHEDAVSHYDGALQRENDLALAHNNRAWLLATELGRTGEAVHHAQRAVSLRPDQPDYRDTLIECLLRDGQREQARRVTAIALERFPANDDLRRRARELIPR